MSNNFKPIFNTRVFNRRVSKAFGITLLSGFVVSSGGCFAKPKGTVQISSSPADLRVLVDGVVKGNTPSTEDGFFTLELIEEIRFPFKL